MGFRGLLVAAFLLGSLPALAGRGAWTRLTAPNADHPYGISAITIGSRDRAIIVAAGPTLFRSTDGGRSWQATVVDCFVGDVRFSSLDGRAYAVCGDFYPPPEHGAVYRSEDSGATWTIDRQTAGVGITHLGFASNRLFIVDQSFVDLHPPFLAAALAVSSDPPGLWEETVIGSGDAGGYVNDLAVIADTGRVLAAWYSFRPLLVPPVHGGVLESLDFGRVWHPASGLPDEPAGPIAVDPFDAAHVLVSVGAAPFASRLYESRDFGSTWSATDHEFPPGITSLAFAPAVPGRAYAGTSGAGVFVSDDGGLTWAESNDGLTDLDVSALAVFGNRIYAGTASGSLFTLGASRVIPVSGAPPSPVVRRSTNPRGNGSRP